MGSEKETDVLLIKWERVQTNVLVPNIFPLTNRDFAFLKFIVLRLLRI